MTYVELSRRARKVQRHAKRQRQLRAIAVISAILLCLAMVGAAVYLIRAYVIDPWLANVEDPPVPSSEFVTVAPGDTLWSIANKHFPGKHTGEIVFKIRKVNPGLDPGRLQIGQRVVLPEVI